MRNSEFKWQRPKLMGMSDFQEFANEVESRVGVGNVKFLEDINRAINGDSPLFDILNMSEENVDEFVVSSGKDERIVRSYLSFLYEIEYRKKNGPALWERKKSIVPCPDYLPPTGFQVQYRRLSVYNILCKIWNISLIVVAAGVIPFMIVPLSKFISAGFGLQGAANVRFSSFTLMAFIVWCMAAVAFLVAFSAARIIRKAK